ncbi:hypothetical protein ACFL3G_02115 [Planctomycetota bacterium]
MNELYFHVEGSAWRSERPTAYYLDELNEFLADQSGKDFLKSFMDDFVKPLTAMYREKYKEICNSDSKAAEKLFQVKIPLDILAAGKIGFEWYASVFPEGEYIDTAKDFIKAAGEAALERTSILIAGQ